jgi:hypothetical protein
MYLHKMMQNTHIKITVICRETQITCIKFSQWSLTELEPLICEQPEVYLILTTKIMTMLL